MHRSAALPRPHTPALPALDDRRRLILWAAGVAVTLIVWSSLTLYGSHVDLVWWHASLEAPYAGQVGDIGFYPYSPALLQFLSPLRALPFSAVVWLWGIVMLSSLVFCARRLTALLIVAPPIVSELMVGNLHLPMAAAIVLGFRWPHAWAFVLLTKVTPGIGLLWFAARREWRSLAVALGTTAAVATVSFLVAPHLWTEWIAAITRSAGHELGSSQYHIDVPLAIRLPLAALVVLWGARTDRRWTVAVAATLALPVLWTAGFSALVGVVALRGAPVGYASAGSQTAQPGHARAPAPSGAVRVDRPG